MKRFTLTENFGYLFSRKLAQLSTRSFHFSVIFKPLALRTEIETLDERNNLHIPLPMLRSIISQQYAVVHLVELIQYWE